MDFQPEIYGPYAPYMDFLLEDMVRKVHRWPFEKEMEQECPNSFFFA